MYRNARPTPPHESKKLLESKARFQQRVSRCYEVEALDRMLPKLLRFDHKDCRRSTSDGLDEEASSKVFTRQQQAAET